MRTGTFQLHRAMNILAVLLTAAAFVIIFVEVEGYTEVRACDVMRREMTNCRCIHYVDRHKLILNM